MAKGELLADDPKIKNLVSIYTRAINKIKADFNAQTSFEKARRTAILKNIKIVLTDLGGSLDDWADENMPVYYKQGIALAENSLANLDAETKKLAPFTQIDRRAVNAITNEVKTAFGESIRGVARSTTRVLTQAEKLEIKAILSEGIITGDTRKKIAAEVKDMLNENGFTALVDKAGKQWQLDSYADMLVRTKAVEARNTGLGNRIQQYGYDLVQVTDHNSSHPACAEWEGEILSYSGNNPDYPSYEDALAGGLFHPRCEHAINVLVQELADKTNAYNPPEEDDTE